MIEICCFVIPWERLGASYFAPLMRGLAPVSIRPLLKGLRVVIVKFLREWMVLEVPVSRRVVWRSILVVSVHVHLQLLGKDARESGFHNLAHLVDIFDVERSIFV